MISGYIYFCPYFRFLNHFQNTENDILRAFFRSAISESFCLRWRDSARLNIKILFIIFSFDYIKKKSRLLFTFLYLWSVLVTSAPAGAFDLDPATRAEKKTITVANCSFVNFVLYLLRISFASTGVHVYRLKLMFHLIASQSVVYLGQNRWILKYIIK